MKLILIPGLDGTGDLFNALSAMFSDNLDFQVVPLPVLTRPDGAIDEQCTQHDIAVALEAEIANSVGNEPFHVLAESFGSSLLPVLLHRNRLNIQGIIMIAGFISTPRSALVTLAQHLPLQTMIRMPVLNYAISLFCLGSGSEGMTQPQLLQTLKKVPNQVYRQRLAALATMAPPEGWCMCRGPATF